MSQQNLNEKKLELSRSKEWRHIAGSRTVIAKSCSDWKKVGHIKGAESRLVTESREQPGSLCEGGQQRKAKETMYHFAGQV